MKKITYVLLIALMSLSKAGSAAMIPVSVQDFLFVPQNINATVGDTIMWLWGAGFHTVTSSTIPAGAASFDEQINSTAPMFMYQVTVAGEYDYVCSFHISMGMIGHISVTGSTGIQSPAAALTSVINNIVFSDLNINFGSSANWKVELRSLTGAVAKEFSIHAEAGRPQAFEMAELPTGIYIVRMTDGTVEKSQRVIKQ